MRASPLHNDPTIDKLKDILEELNSSKDNIKAFRKIFNSPWRLRGDPLTPADHKYIVPARALPYIYDSLYDELARRIMTLSADTEEDRASLRGKIQNWESLSWVNRTPAVSIVLKQMPIPKPDTSIEQILEFRSEEENKHKLERLRLWMKRIAIEDKSVNEVKQELEEGLFEYEETMRLNKMEFDRSTSEVILVTSAEILENLMKLKLSSALKSLFELRKSEVEQLKAEATALGKEFAYISNIRKSFT